MGVCFGPPIFRLGGYTYFRLTCYLKMRPKCAGLCVRWAEVSMTCTVVRPTAVSPSLHPPSAMHHLWGGAACKRLRTPALGQIFFTFVGLGRRICDVRLREGTPGDATRKYSEGSAIPLTRLTRPVKVSAKELPLKVAKATSFEGCSP